MSVVPLGAVEIVPVVNATEVISEFAPLAAAPKLVLAPDAVVDPVPPCKTVTAALSVKIVALAFGSVKVFSVVAGPDNLANPFPVPP
jgi:hypothetical protein